MNTASTAMSAEQAVQESLSGAHAPMSKVFPGGIATTVGASAEVHLVLGAPAQTLKPCEKHPDRYCNCEGYYPACRDAAGSTTGKKL
ncbi:hypothetical protein NL532_32060 [Mesorhizobium sp. C120A]|uniref:hypothetical protein n=1 Tax=unclassified Mesorhizobium TaxID=325217 RepID=UPI0003D0601F|nr:MULTISPECIES: hypothetical protein [unclassified Mesorhizobium]ESZ63759.1 hypothetical protein X728_09050 [Mesorhizobium sp. L103C120A0]WJI45078.1 hypothetical protein NL532_32060 [Mesorhizobium sp. C120A]